MGADRKKVEPWKLDVFLRHSLALEIFGRAEGTAFRGSKLGRKQSGACERTDGQGDVEAVPQQSNAVIAKDADEADLGILLEERRKVRSNEILADDVGNRD